MPGYLNSTFDVIVIGVGATGAATCRELSRRGLRVLGLDQFDIPNTRGSVTSHSRAIRLAYFEHPNYVPLIQRAFSHWERLEAETGIEMLHVTGAVYAGPSSGSVVDKCVEAARTHNLEHDVLTPFELESIYPQFHLPVDFSVFHEKRAGYISSLAAVRTMVLDALRHGCVMRGHEQASNWESDSTGVVVLTDSNEYRANSLVICAGGWAPELLKLNLDLTVTRQFTSWIWPAEPPQFREGVFPIFGIELCPEDLTDGRQGYFYGFPMNDDELGFKSAIHRPGAPCAPDCCWDFDRQSLQRASDEIMRPIRRYFPKADGPVLATRPCIYTYSPDGHFVVDKHPSSDRVSFAAGLSGHGFKFAPVLGEILADLAQNGSTVLDVKFLSLDRSSLISGDSN